MPPPITIRRLTDVADPAVAAAVAIYVEALPASERKPTAWLASLPARPDYRLTVAELAGRTVAFAVLFIPVDPSDAALLEYVAVAADARDGGVGGRLVDAVLNTAGRPVLVEVQSEDPLSDRRRAFYVRRGCREVVGASYVCPLPDAPPMRLMVANAAAVGRDELARWLSTVYADVYGQRRDDPRLPAMTAALSDPVFSADAPS